MSRYKNPIVSAIALGVVLLMAVLILVLSSGKKAPPPTAPKAPSITATPLSRSEKLVGVCLPEENDAWTATGEQLRSQLTSLGYQVQLVYSDGTAKSQNKLLLELMEQKADCLVVAPVDSAALAEAESVALAQKIPILAYGALLMDTEAVSGYICYDYQAMGMQIARRIENTLSLSTAATENRSYTVELFMGAPEDYNAVLLHKGLLSVLEPYLSAKVLVCNSHRTAFEDSCILDWSESNAEAECANRLKNSYADTAPDICICASDSIANGVILALEKAGVKPENWPLITGNGATTEGIANLEAGKQLLTVQNDPATPAIACGGMVDWVLFGVVPEVTMGAVFNNAISVPTALCGFTLVDKKTGRLCRPVFDFNWELWYSFSILIIRRDSYAAD